MCTDDITPEAGPNGSEAFLNCGVESGGWTPPPVEINDLVTMDLSEALKDPNSPFKNCQAYVSLFEQYGKQTGSTYHGHLFPSRESLELTDA